MLNIIDLIGDLEIQAKNRKNMTAQEVFKRYISNDPTALEYVEKLRNAKTSVCGKRIEQKTLSFQCFDCAPDPHHMFCSACFVKEKHKSFQTIFISKDHKFIMRHNIGGCCDCGDEKTIQPSGACDNHRGFDEVDIPSELERIPGQLKDLVLSFLQAIILYYTTTVQKANLDFDIWLHKCKELAVKFSVIDDNFKQALDEAIEISKDSDKAQQHELGAYLYNICFTFISWLVDQNMPFIILITEMLMKTPTEFLQKSVNTQTSESYIDLIVKTGAHIDGGHIHTRGIDDILYLFHANPVFKEFLQQTMLKQYQHLKLIKFEIPFDAKKNLQQFQKQIEELSEEQRQGVFIKGHIQNSFRQTALTYIAKFKDIQNKTEHARERKKIIFEYRAEIHSHHTQFVSIEHQREFFFSQHIPNFFKMLALYYSYLTEFPMEDFGLILNTSYWLTLRTEYTFFPQIHMMTLEKIFSPSQMNEFCNQNCLKSRLTLPLTYYVDSFFCSYLNALSKQKPAEVYSEKLWKDSNTGSYLVINYNYIQQTNLSIFFNSFFKVLNMSNNKAFNLNLTLSLFMHSYNLLQQRNALDTFELKTLKVIEDDPTDPPQVQLYRMSQLSIMNATTIDRTFSTLLVCLYYLTGLTHDEFLQFLEFHLKMSAVDILQGISLAVSRAIQSYSSIGLGIDQNEFGSKLYAAKINQSSVNLQSCDLALIKMYLFLSDEKSVAEFARLIDAQNLPNNVTNLTRHNLILDLLLSDQDLINVSGQLFPQLPIDQKNYFRKYLRTIFMAKNYQSYTNLKTIFAQNGILKGLPLSQYILEVCELDNYIRELRLKPQFYDQKLYDPHILNGASELKGQITESICDTKDSDIDPTFGNFITNDFQHDVNHPCSSIGPIRLHLWKRFLGSPQLLDQLFLKYTEEINISKNSIDVMLRVIFYFNKANDKLNLMAKQDKEIQRQLINKLKVQSSNLKQQSFHQAQQLHQEGGQQKEQTNKIFKSVEEALDGQSSKMQEETPTNFVDPLIQTKLQQKRQLLQKRFANQQAQFNKNFEVSSQMEAEVQEYERCQSCKLPIENSQESCFPGLLQQSNIDKYLNPQEPDDFESMETQLHSCKHRFHASCLQKTAINSNNQSLPQWLQLSCPICKLGMNTFVNLILNLEPTKMDKQINDYFSHIDSYVNFNERVADIYCKKYDHIQNYDLRAKLIFYDINISIATNLFLQMSKNSVEFFKRGDNELLANVIQILYQYRCLSQIQQDNKLINELVDQSLYQTKENYDKNNRFVARQISAAISYILGIGSFDQAGQILSNVINGQPNQEKVPQNYIIQGLPRPLQELKDQTLQIIYKFKSIRRIDSTQFTEIFTDLTSQYNEKQREIFSEFASQIGKDFQEFYMRYFPIGCDLCGFFPEKYNNDSTAQIHYCLLCRKVICPVQCSRGETRSELGNLNQHADDFHCGLTIFISLNTGYVNIVKSPITYLDYKNLFYDSMGQKIKILDPKINWKDYKLDERELKDIIEVLRNKRETQIIGSLEDERRRQSIEYRGLL